MHHEGVRDVKVLLAGLTLLGCSGGGLDVDGGSAVDGVVGEVRADASPDVRDAIVDGRADAGPACCPAGFTLYSCQVVDGGPGLACHNPAMGCASSMVCGQGCDPVVSGRCACVQTELCVVGDRFDTTLCACVPDPDASPPDAGTCIDTVLCIMGDHFDTALCRCVPNSL